MEDINRVADFEDAQQSEAKKPKSLSKKSVIASAMGSQSERNEALPTANQ